MKKSKQLTFGKLCPRLNRKFFGGALLAGKRKSIRPLSAKDSIHLVLRSEWATGKDSFLARRNCNEVNRILAQFTKRFGVRIYQKAIAGNHIHLLVKITSRRLYRGFIKAISGKIASLAMGGRSFLDFYEAKNSSLSPERGDGSRSGSSEQNFWQFRPFSRVVNWGNDFRGCMNYLKQNTLEALGIIPYKKRTNDYAKWLGNSIAKPVGSSRLLLGSFFT